MDCALGNGTGFKAAHHIYTAIQSTFIQHPIQLPRRGGWFGNGASPRRPLYGFLIQFQSQFVQLGFTLLGILRADRK